MKRFHFGTNLRQIRLSQELSQEYVAQRIGVSQSTYSRWELDDKPVIQMDQLEALAQCFNVPLTYIISPVTSKSYKVPAKFAMQNKLADSFKSKPTWYYWLVLIAAILFIGFAVYEFLKGFLHALSPEH
ncbi:MAG: XRE family transcriptional regulator [Pedobacter sp.]|nr:MAG: XRE family transcriptional regulator [Pedobacter sp.]